jgi:hypothetical protein
MRNVLLVVLLLGTAAAPLLAAPACEGLVLYGATNDRPVFSNSEKAPATVAVGGRELFVIPGAAMDYPAAQRREIVESRVTLALSTCPDAPVHIMAINGKPTVYIGMIRLITVYPSDVAGAGARSARQLAMEWRQATRAAMLEVGPLVNSSKPCTPKAYTDATGGAQSASPAETVPFD